MDLGLQDKVCVVTGSTAGIGLAVAAQLQAEGAKVVTSGRRSEGIGDLHVAADLARPGEPQRMIEAALEQFARVDCLVNNVGWAEMHRFDELTEELWEKSWQLNLMSAVRATQAVLPGMRERGAGAIVNVSSTAAKRPSTGMPEYSVTKAAMLSLSRLVADLYAKDGIRCNAITPGPTATDAWLGEGGLADQQGARDEILAKAAAGRPIGRLAEPDEIAAVIVFLCSDRASYVTGAAWSADGGTVPIII
jgi:3-oxoacyl-[acyl-carrier protein] reductase